MLYTNHLSIQLHSLLFKSISPLWEKNYLYPSEKIKLLKDSYGNGSINAIVFICPGETEVANSGKDWNKNRKESLKEYFKDWASVVETVEKDGYNVKTEEGYQKLVNDYSSNCH